METISSIHKRRIAQLIRDPRYWNSSHPEHAQVLADTQQAFNDAYPSSAPDEKTSSGTVHVRAYTRTVDGKEVEVSAYDRTQQVAFKLPAALQSASKLFTNIAESDLHKNAKEYAARKARENGDVVETEIEVKSLRGVPTTLDFLGRRPDGHFYAIEFKTPGYNSFSMNQMLVFRYLDLGYHVNSYDPKILSFGFKPGQLLPPMCIYGVFLNGNGSIDHVENLGLSPDCN
jgi:hypothetical protein